MPVSGSGGSHVPSKRAGFISAHDFALVTLVILWHGEHQVCEQRHHSVMGSRPIQVIYLVIVQARTGPPPQPKQVASLNSEQSRCPQRRCLLPAR